MPDYAPKTKKKKKTKKEHSTDRKSRKRDSSNLSEEATQLDQLSKEPNAGKTKVEESSTAGLSLADG